MGEAVKALFVYACKIKTSICSSTTIVCINFVAMSTYQVSNYLLQDGGRERRI